MSDYTGKVWTVLTMLEWATDYFEQKGVDSPRMSIEWLLAEILEIRRLDLYLQYDRPLSTDELNRIRPLIKRRAKHEPLQQITGSTDFLGCTIAVNRSVLIPRPETEQLTEVVLDRFSERKTEELSILDIGTGSGCIPIAIQKKYPSWRCTGIDISEKALNTARKNAETNQTNCEFLHCDMLEAGTHPEIGNRDWDIIISNPPYIKPEERESLEIQVSHYEPEVALFHHNPLSLYVAIAQFAKEKKSSLFLECSSPLAEDIHVEVSRILPGAELLKDYSDLNRFLIAL
ncbi:MAG: peptide chain release factor N(5)-glutamine methyltransferase [Balneolaceae bacterium]|nr:peptide chain release factor N(5)-glutamine methyltransferase [Balneolaceae bacterium]MCH8549326.1 peptide chain release factor N(5)-glutamine methyltransferase [Balneolaceae bacterium]